MKTALKFLLVLMFDACGLAFALTAIIVLAALALLCLPLAPLLIYAGGSARAKTYGGQW